MTSSESENALNLLRRQTRERRLRIPLLVLFGGLLATTVVVWKQHPEFFSGSIALPLFLLWTAGIFFSGGIAGLLWWRQRPSMDQTARDLDEALHSKNRLEAASQLHDSSSAIATAQRLDASRYVKGHAKKERPWLALVAALTALLILFQFVMSCLWIWDSIEFGWWDGKPKNDPRAEIQWVEPDSEIKANKLEEIPLTASVKTNVPLKDTVLRIQVNGTEVQKMALKKPVMSKAGEYRLEPSLYLDSLEIEAFDLVSYYIQSAYDVRGKWEPATSPMQFIQITRLREDVGIVEDAKGIGKVPALLSQLKAAQLALIKQNFVLNHSGMKKSSDVWKQENQQVHADQVLLAEKTQSVIDFLIANGAPAEMVDLLSQAKPEILRAGGWIAEAKNEEALVPQGKALSLIIECEKLIDYVIPKNGESDDEPPPKNVDPFKDEQKFEMPPRSAGAAGELEKLEQEQRELLKELEQIKEEQQKPGEKTPEQKKAEDKKLEELGRRQRDIQKRIGQLQKNGDLAGSVENELERAGNEAGNAGGQLEQRDAGAAREPAAKALGHLSQALKEMNRRAEEAAREALSEAMKKLNEAADKMSGQEKDPKAGEGQGEGEGPGDQKEDGQGKKKAEQAAGAVAEAQTGIEKEALKQQQQGSEHIAKSLADLAGEIERKGIKKDLKDLSQPGDRPGDQAKAAQTESAIKELAARAALQRMALSSGENRFSELAQQLTSVQRGLKGLARREFAEQGEEKGQQPGSGDKPGDKPGSGPGSMLAQAEFVNASGSGTEGSGGTGSGSEMKEALIEQLQTTVEMVALLTDDQEVQEAIEKIKGSTGGSTNPETPEIIENVEVLVTSLESPLNQLITWLHAQANHMTRTELLNRDNAEEAPEGYREAVMRYFERLSLDFDKTKKEPITP
ncbi:MAG: hypothetical protein ACFCUX_08750 [Candidatus Methylacidiphilales bacterium]